MEDVLTRLPWKKLLTAISCSSMGVRFAARLGRAIPPAESIQTLLSGIIISGGYDFLNSSLCLYLTRGVVIDLT